MKSLFRIRTFEQFSSSIAMTPGPRPRKVWPSMTAGQSPQYDSAPEAGRLPRGIAGGGATGAAAAAGGAGAAGEGAPGAALASAAARRSMAGAEGSSDGRAI